MTGRKDTNEHPDHIKTLATRYLHLYLTPLNPLSVRLFVRLSVRPSVRPSARISLQSSAGARKKPPVGGLNFLVMLKLSIPSE